MKIAGIGSRKTPKPIAGFMEIIPCALGDVVVRSGGADGADLAFERGAESKEIFLPWKGFNGSASNLYLDNLDPALVQMATELILTTHPKGRSLTQGPLKLHMRNVFQVLGKNLDDPVDMVICWTPDGAYKTSQLSSTTGGTGTAIRLANSLDIPVYNLKNKKHFQYIEQLIERW